MIYFRLIVMAFKNILISRKKSTSAILSIASGFLALNLFQAYIYDTEILFDVTYENRSMFGHLLLRKEHRADNTSPEEQQVVNKFLEDHASLIDSKVRFLWFSGLINTGSISTVFAGWGHDIDQGLKMRSPYWPWNTTSGVPLHEAPKGVPAILVGQRLGEVIKCKEDQKIEFKVGKIGYPPVPRGYKCENDEVQLSLSTATGQANAASFKVVGITNGVFSAVDQRLVIAPIEAVQSLMNTQDISMVAIKLKDGGDARKLQKAFADKVQKKYPDLRLKSWKDYEIGDFYNKSIEFLNIFRNFITIVVISIGALSVMTTFYRLVFERTREIGTLLSIGFRPQHIFVLFLHEALFLAIFGILVGIVLSFALAFVINLPQVNYKVGMLSEAVTFAVTISPNTMTFSAVVLLLISVGICIFPVKRALSMRITEALRDV
jgi:hypothetical protein